jgi:adenylosuccinate synthase
VFDLGPGDGGKGGVVHKLSCQHQAHTIIKVGGAQGSHGVSTKRCDFAFSQWGCGTFEGVKTHISPLMIVSPDGLLNESDGLRYCGITNAFDLLTADGRALVATPYHGIVSRLKEIARRGNPRGTVGTGVGEAFRDSLRFPDDIIRVSDLTRDLRSELSQIRDRQIMKIMVGLGACNLVDFLGEDLEVVSEEIALLNDDGFLDYCVNRFREVGRLLNIVDPDYMNREIFGKDGIAIVESSHGILTDNQFGFQPHVSAIRTLPSFAQDMLLDAGFDGEIAKIGVHRAYTVRHGAGPMPTADSTMNDDLLPGSCKEENRYQGKVRVGPLDFVLLRYAIDVCGGPEAIDGLAISWFDQISRNGAWKVCNIYDEYDRNYFLDSGRIRIFGGDPDSMSDYQQELCLSLFACRPEISSIALPDSMEGQYRLCDQEMCDKLGVPVYLVSFGPTERDKFMKDVV